jgi:2-hydroxychromene-2-carboxylate isomerase
MKTLDWYFDFVSPYSYLQHEILHTLDAEIRYKPILFAGLLNAWGHKGPVEIPEKRRFTYRNVLWVAGQHGIPLKFPPAHPFNPLRVLRLAIALDNDTNAIAAIFHFIWQKGESIENEQSWKTLCAELKVDNAEARIADPRVKETLRKNGEDAVGLGIFGVPTAVVDGELFWGFDATPMLKSYLANPEMFKRGELARVSNLPGASGR